MTARSVVLNHMMPPGRNRRRLLTAGSVHRLASSVETISEAVPRVAALAE
jgi:hypothetical protein